MSHFHGRNKFNHNRKPFNKHGKPHFKPKTFNNKPEYKHQDQLNEKEVGITEFISKLEGFSGIIKMRFSDFHVNEINLLGETAKLTNTSVPQDFIVQQETKPIDELNETAPEIIPQEVWTGVKALLKSDTDDIAPVEFDVSTLSKEDRTKVHKTMKDSFGKKLIAHTITRDNKKYIVFKKYKKGEESIRRNVWPEDKGEYVHFQVFKESLDTLETCLKISDCLHMPASAFTYAGVKDRRAKTTQWFCVHKVQPWKLLKKTRPLKNIKIGNLLFKDSPLKLGHLQGNRFRVALRNVLGDDDLIKSSMESLKENGFINYYGLQRFGNDKEVPTFSIGIKLLLGEFKEACALILKSKKSDDSQLDISKAKKIYEETGNASKACDAISFSRNKCVEAKLLSGLAKGHANDFVNALECIPRNMRLLYIHSFQSLIWNQMVSKRLQEFGTKPVEGDLVLLQNSEGNTEIDEINEDSDATINKKDVKILTAADVNDYTIYDIVLPLPGYDIVYPENMKQFYKEALESHGLSLEMPKQSVKTYTLSGTYRKVIEKVSNFSWKIMHYSEPHYNLIRSDFEELKGFSEPKSVEDGKFKALVLDFCLKSSCYATMVLREVMKTDTSSSAHALLNNSHASQENAAEENISKRKSMDDLEGSEEPSSKSLKVE